MHDLTAKRTLVKSPPELWSELSEVDRLARHLDAFGEIKITRLVPEHTVAWEGDGASGTVSIEPSGWGTKVTLTAQLEGEAAVGAEAAPVIEEPVVEEPAAAAAALDEPDPEDEPWAEQPQIAEGEAVEPEAEEPIAVSSVEAMEPAEPMETLPKRKRGFLAWLFRPRTSAQGTEAEPAAAAPAPAAAAPEPAAEAPMAEEPESDIAGDPPEADMAEPEAPAPEPDTLAAELAAVQKEPEPVSSEPDAIETEPDGPGGRSSLDPDRVRAVLDEVLDTLGSAHHRPFSRG